VLVRDATERMMSVCGHLKVISNDHDLMCSGVVDTYCAFLSGIDRVTLCSDCRWGFCVCRHCFDSGSQDY
jgi:hypothetical protein